MTILWCLQSARNDTPRPSRHSLYSQVFTSSDDETNAHPSYGGVLLWFWMTIDKKNDRIFLPIGRIIVFQMMKSEDYVWNALHEPTIFSSITDSFKTGIWFKQRERVSYKDNQNNKKESEWFLGWKVGRLLLLFTRIMFTGRLQELLCLQSRIFTASDIPFNASCETYDVCQNTLQ